MRQTARPHPASPASVFGAMPHGRPRTSSAHCRCTSPPSNLDAVREERPRTPSARAARLSTAGLPSPGVPLYAETFELNIAFVPADPRLPFGDRDLLLDRVHPFEVGKEQPAAPSLGNDDAVFAHIEIVEPGGRLRLLKDVDRIFEIVELVGRNGRETRILARRCG